MTRALGADVSHHQGFIDWEKLAQQIEFVFIKLTEGDDWIDPSSIENVREALSHNILVGGYHYYKPRIDPDLQADHFIAELARWERIGLHLPAAVDVEEGAPGFVNGLEHMFRRLEEALYKRPIIYTATWFYNENLSQSEYLRQFDLWLANWTGAQEPLLPYVRPAWEFWQYTSSAHGPSFGVESLTLDLDRFNGTTPELIEKYPQQPVLKKPVGSPRVDYRRKAHVIPQEAPVQVAHDILEVAARNKESVGWSADDACMGDLSDKTAVFWNLSDQQQSEYDAWVDEHYPETTIEFKQMAASEPAEPAEPADSWWRETFESIANMFRR